MFAEILDDLLARSAPLPIFTAVTRECGFTPLPLAPRESVSLVKPVRPHPAHEVWVDGDGTAHDPFPSLFPPVMACSELAPRRATLVMFGLTGATPCRMCFRRSS